MFNTKRLMFVALAVASASAVAADDLLVTTEKANAANVAALDFSSSGKATGLEFRLKAPTDAVVDTSKCLSQLPKSHSGVCTYNKVEGYVVGMVFSDSNALLPAGLVSIGTITVQTQAKNEAGVFEVLHFLAADDKAVALQGEAKVMRSSDTK